MSEAGDRSEASWPSDSGFRNAAAVCAISFPLAIGSALTGLAAVNFNVAAVSDPTLLLRAGHRAAGLWRASLLLDLFGYYLLIVPLTLALRATFRPRAGTWSDLYGFCLLAYSLVGAIGAAMLAMATPPMIEAFAGAAPAARQALTTAYAVQSDDVYRGLWNLLETLLGGVGWVGFGSLLWSQARRVGALTIALGVSTLTDSFGEVVNQPWLSQIGLNLYLALATAWPLVMGIRLLGRRPLAGSA
ncbi:MAG TPA: hypothetical protein VGS12_14455 [Caulobacteraceae bacterium]|nr:hypothetical protein [Caulobacteraceae bacterium]